VNVLRSPLDFISFVDLWPSLSDASISDSASADARDPLRLPPARLAAALGAKSQP
jgi:hypothetical protein